MIRMKESSVDPLYKRFGKLVQLHRKRLPDMTQDRLASLVGLSRTSITNIEQGRQHVSLHQLYAIAEALKVQPDVLLPNISDNLISTAQVSTKLPAGIDKDISHWAQKVVTGKN